MLRKRAQGISLNTIIIAAIALLVLVIVSVIFMGRMGLFTRNSNDCLRQDGKCMDRACEEGYIQHPSAVCYTGGEPDEYQVCCVKMNV
jgi:hypothetical protein